MEKSLYEKIRVDSIKDKEFHNKLTSLIESVRKLQKEKVLFSIEIGKFSLPIFTKKAIDRSGYLKELKESWDPGCGEIFSEYEPSDYIRFLNN